MNKHMLPYLSLIGIVASFALALSSCRPQPPMAKPKGYFRLDLPSQHQYLPFDQAGFPFEFEYPIYGRISQDTLLIQEEKAPYWINVVFDDWNATIFLSYKSISKQEPLEKLIDESYNLSMAHDIRADFIKTPAITTQHQLHGVLYNVGGNAASAYQFYITDSFRHFMRGSLYFGVSPNADSLKPAIEFFKKDLEHLVNTMRFK